MSHDRRHHAVLSILHLVVGTVDAGALDEGDDLRRELLDVLGNECQCRGGVDASGLEEIFDAVVGPSRGQEVAQPLNRSPTSPRWSKTRSWMMSLGLVDIDRFGGEAVLQSFRLGGMASRRKNCRTP